MNLGISAFKEFVKKNKIYFLAISAILLGLMVYGIITTNGDEVEELMEQSSDLYDRELELGVEKQELKTREAKINAELEQVKTKRNEINAKLTPYKAQAF